MLQQQVEQLQQVVILKYIRLQAQGLYVYLVQEIL
tara:strand:+ start:81 stop:185 length:105 start_codon:yes stop_codon:yes gene_type:complete